MEYTSFNKLLKSNTIQDYLNKLKDGTIRGFVDDWKWIFTFTKRYKWIVLFYTVLGLFSSTLGLASSYISSRLINIITGRQTEKLFILIIAVVGSAVFSLVFQSVMSRVSTKISIYVNNDIQKEIFDSIIDVKWMDLNRFQNGDLLNRFNSDVGTISGNAIGWIPNIIINIYTFIITFVVLYRMDPIMAAIALLSAPFLMFMSRYIMRKQKEYRTRVLEMNSGMMSFETEAFYNLDTVKAFGIWGMLSARLRMWQKKYKQYNLEYNMFSIKTNIALTVLTTAVSFASFGYCLYRLWTGQILYGDMTFFLSQRSALSNQFSSLVSTVPGMLNSAVSAHRVRELVDLPKEEHDAALLETVRQRAENGLAVEMQGVTFAYTEGTNIYENAHFVANPGEIVAIMGQSGGGKTTMFRLLLGMCEPGDGFVVLRDATGQEFSMNADLRQLVAYVPQGNTMMMGTIAENLRMVKPEATDEELIAALKTACAWEFVEETGLYSQLGERGKGISEGQAQRISIARALLRDAPILLLDEATSALDEATESRVIDTILQAAPNKTVIISTHRPSVLRRCRRVFRISEKQIAEDSSFVGA